MRGSRQHCQAVRAVVRMLQSVIHGYDIPKAEREVIGIAFRRIHAFMDAAARRLPDEKARPKKKEKQK